MPIKTVGFIKRWGILLERLKIDDIEIVREWRNSDDVSKYMFFQKKISSEEQLKWFHSIDNDYNYYFMIVSDNKKIGLINLKNINKARTCAEIGIFSGSTRDHSNPAFGLATWILAGFAFDILNLDYIFYRVRHDNTNASKFFKKFARIVEEDDLFKIYANAYYDALDTNKTINYLIKQEELEIGYI